MQTWSYVNCSAKEHLIHFPQQVRQRHMKIGRNKWFMCWDFFLWRGKNEIAFTFWNQVKFLTTESDGEKFDYVASGAKPISVSWVTQGNGTKHKKCHGFMAMKTILCVRIDSWIFFVCYAIQVRKEYCVTELVVMPLQNGNRKTNLFYVIPPIQLGGVPLVT